MFVITNLLTEAQLLKTFGNDILSHIAESAVSLLGQYCFCQCDFHLHFNCNLTLSLFFVSFYLAVMARSPAAYP